MSPIALNAASDHDGTLYCVAGSCVNGTFRASDGQSLSVVGGTSVATPEFAGVLALVEQKIGSKIGNAGPHLYALANSSFYTSVFNDITTGNNTSPCTAGTINCPAGGVLGYSATVGYDQATGWGSVNASNLATDWSQVTPIPPSTTIGTINSVTTLTTSSPVCGVSNGTLALNIKVASAVSSNFPTGTVQLLVDNALSGSPIALSSGSATFSYSTANLTSGTHNITALYSGDVNYAASKGYITTDVVSWTKPDFAFTPCTSSSVVPGGTAPGVAFTVAPVNGFTGTVTFTANSDDASLAATYAFTPTTVTTSGTTSFVLYAFVSNATTSTGLNKLHAAKQEPIRAPWYLPGPERHSPVCFCWPCPANVAGERSLWLSFRLESWEQPAADRLAVPAAAVVVAPPFLQPREPITFRSQLLRRPPMAWLSTTPPSPSPCSRSPHRVPHPFAHFAIPGSPPALLVGWDGVGYRLRKNDRTPQPTTNPGCPILRAFCEGWDVNPFPAVFAVPCAQSPGGWGTNTSQPTYIEAQAKTHRPGGLASPQSLTIRPRRPS